MRLISSKLFATRNIARIVITTSLFGAFLSAPQSSNAAPSVAPTPVITVTGAVSGTGPLLAGFSSAGSSSGVASPTLTTTWSFGDGLTSTLGSVNHIFALPGSYTVQMTVTNSASESASATTLVTVTGAAVLPVPYTGVNIGTFVPGAVPGSKLYSTGAFSGSLTTCSNGVDIYTPPDDLRFAYRSMSGDGEVIGRLVDLNRLARTGADKPGNGKTGLMIRETVTDGSKYIFIGTDGIYSSDPWAADARFTYRAQWRTATEGDSNNQDVSTPFPSNELPRWFKLARQLNTFSASLSIDGVTWVQQLTQVITMPTNVLAGYAVTSIDSVTPAPMNCAQFDGLALTDTPAPPILPTAVLSATPTSGAAPLIVQLDASASNSAGPIPGIKSYLWSFGDGVTSTEIAPIHVYPVSGTYSVQLTATNFDDNTAVQNTSITVAAGSSTGTLPAPWVSKDLISILGKPGSSNLASFNNNNVLASCGSGLDVQGTDDQFRFDYYPLTGNGEIKARMLNISQPTGSFGNKGGIMIRAAATRDAAYVALLQNKQTNPNDSALRYQNRLVAGADSANDYVEGYSEPKWMKITRTGDVFVSYTATTGLDWTPVATTTVAMSQTVLAGFAVTSIDNSSVSCAVFDNVSLPGTEQSKFKLYLPLLGR